MKTKAILILLLVIVLIWSMVACTPQSTFESNAVVTTQPDAFSEPDVSSGSETTELVTDKPFITEAPPATFFSSEVVSTDPTHVTNDLKETPARTDTTVSATAKTSLPTSGSTQTKEPDITPSPSVTWNSTETPEPPWPSGLELPEDVIIP